MNVENIVLFFLHHSIAVKWSFCSTLCGHCFYICFNLFLSYFPFQSISIYSSSGPFLSLKRSHSHPPPLYFSILTFLSTLSDCSLGLSRLIFCQPVCFPCLLVCLPCRACLSVCPPASPHLIVCLLSSYACFFYFYPVVCEPAVGVTQCL